MCFRCKSLETLNFTGDVIMAKTLFTKKQMIIDGKSFQDIQKQFKSVTKKEIAALAYKYSSKDMFYQVPGLDSSDTYVNGNGSIVIGQDAVLELGLNITDGFTLAADDNGGFTAKFTGQVDLPPKKIKKKKEEAE
jgi:hypothetical protein